MEAAVERRLASVLGTGMASCSAETTAPPPPPTIESLQAELSQERERRSILEARLCAQRSVTLRLRDENEALTAQLASATQRLKRLARARDEMRKALEQADGLDKGLLQALARRKDSRTEQLCAALRQRVQELEMQSALVRHKSHASFGIQAQGSNKEVNGPLTVMANGRRLSWD